MTMQLERPELVEHFRTFVAHGSGVLVGPPGVGKTFLLKKYCTERLDADEPCLYLPIDKLGATSEAELMDELGIRNTFAQYLASEQRHSPQPVLVIDAFDAARSELAQRFVLGLVRRVQEQLDDHWRLIVSVRSYDAKHSVTLQSFFPRPADSQIPPDYQDPEIPCRHFAVPLLSPLEVQTAVASIAGFSAIYEVSRADFRALMRVPFNIWLAESLLATAATASDLSMVASESQLLGLFWAHRVTSGPHAAERTAVLSRVTARMVEEHALTAAISEVYPFHAKMQWDALLSVELLEEVQPQRQRIAFSHNILFDYAVSALLIARDPANACRFFEDDPSRPLFLRPSLDYFFTGLWDSSPEEFWNLVWYMLRASGAHVRVYARLVPAMAIAREARSPGHLAPLLRRVHDRGPGASTFLCHVFQAVRGLFKGQRDELWAEVGRQAAVDIQPQFAGELAALTLEILDRAIGTKFPVVDMCGETGRTILEWALRTRVEPADAFVDNVGAIYGVPLVSRTFATNVVKSRQLVARVLDQVVTAHIPIRYLSQLTRELPHIWPVDSDVAEDVYTRTFAHEERSDDLTYIGTPILPMTSTRRQDFSMCQYHLAEHFPSFLDYSFVSAARAAVRSLNGFVVQSHVAPYVKPGYSIADLTDKFAFRDRTATYVHDLSHIWETGGGRDYALSLGDRLLRRVEDDARIGSDRLIDSFLDLLAEEAQVAFWWKRILELGSRVPSFFAGRLFSLVVARPVLRNSETVHAVGLFIEQAAQYFSSGQRQELEILVLGLVDDGDADALVHRRDQLLSCFPRELLTTAEAQRLRTQEEARGSVARNEPLVRMWSSSEPYSENEWLRDAGANPDDPKNQTLLSVTKPADEFASRWLNERPTAESIREFVPRLKAAFNEVRGNAAADEAVLQQAWTRLAEGAGAVATGLSVADGEAFVLAREILLTGLQADSPIANDTASDEAYTFASWSPSPATAAARGLAWLARLGSNEDVLEACATLAADPRPSVRFLVAQESFRFLNAAPRAFWRIVEQRASDERRPSRPGGPLSDNCVRVGNGPGSCGDCTVRHCGSRACTWRRVGGGKDPHVNCFVAGAWEPSARVGTRDYESAA